MARKKSPKCGANTRQGTPCRNKAGKGTDHPGVGRCENHGGSSPGAPMGNENALVTGEYQQIYYSTLNAGEKHLWDTSEVKPLPQITDELRLTTVRIHRMLLRINDLKAQAESYNENRIVDGLRPDSMLPVSKSYTGGFQAQGKVNFTVTEYESANTQIMAIEAALDRMQSLKTGQIRQLAATLEKVPQQSGGLEGIVDAITRSAKAIAAEKHEQAKAQAANDGD